MAWEISGSGLIYHFKENGEVDHEHSFEAVRERLIDSGGNLETMEEYGEYSVKERQFINWFVSQPAFINALYADLMWEV